MKSKINSIQLLCLSVLLVVISCKKEETAYQDISYFSVNSEGELIRPTDYRTWVYVGTPVTPNDLNGGKAPFPEIHNVYIDPASYKEYKKSGKFREGTIIIKELVSVGATSAVSGKGYFAGEFIGLEASVKSKKHFPNEPGNWAIFSFTSPKDGILKDKTKPFPASACNACHQANAADDYVFTQYYPVLRAAKAVGDLVNPENAARREASEKESEDKDAGIWDATAPTPENIDIGIPLKEKELFAYLQKGDYKKFKHQEKETHKSAGPHETVRTYINDILAKSLLAENTEHPIGSFAVKEQFKADGSSLGWAVMAKTQDKADRGNGWFWYEVLDDKDVTKRAAFGNNVKGCVSCHAVGKDMVRANFPFSK